MGFVELEKGAGLKRLSVDAVYRVNNKGAGTLRFTKNGTEKLAKLKQIDANKPFKLYIDRETKSLAFKQTEEGQFKLSGLTHGKNSLSYAAISKEITQMSHYMIKESKEYAFVLVLAKDAAVVKPEESEVAPEPKAEESEPTAKKSRSKKK